MKFPTLATLATAATLALPSQADAQWATAGAYVSGTHDFTLVRVEGGNNNSYSWLDMTGKSDGKINHLFGQSQWWLDKKLNKNIALTAGAEYEGFTGGSGNLTPQVGANIAAGDFSGSVRLGGARIGASSGYLSLAASHPFRNGTISGWMDVTRQKGKYDRIGELSISAPLPEGTHSLTKGWHVNIIVQDHPYLQGRIGAIAGVKKSLP